MNKDSTIINEPLLSTSTESCIIDIVFKIASFVFA